MKRNTRIIILLGVLVVICIATFAVSRYEENVEQIKNSKEVILDLASEDAEKISWETEDYSWSFRKDGDTWFWDEDDAFPVNNYRMDSLIDMFGGYEADFIITDVEDYSQYGLDDPVCTVNITTADGEYTITMGDFSTLDHERYISINGGDVYLVENDPLERFELEPEEIIEHDTIDYILVADTVTFEGLEDYGIYYEEDSEKSYCPDDVYFVTGSDDPLDTSKVRSYLRNLSNTTLYDYASYSASDEELERFGMNDPVLIISVDYTDTDEDDNELSKSLTLTIGQDQEELAELASSAEDQTENTSSGTDDDTDPGATDSDSVGTYIRLGDSQIIYNLAQTSYDTLTAVTYDDLRHADVLPVDFDTVTQIDIGLDGNTYTIFSEAEDPDDEDPVRLFYYYYDGKVKDPDELEEDEDIEDYRKEVDIYDLEEALDRITADSFTDESPSEKQEISITVYLDNENFPKVTVELYRYDGEDCLAVIDGVPTSLVPRSAVIDLEEEIYGIVL